MSGDERSSNRHPDTSYQFRNRMKNVDGSTDRVSTSRLSHLQHNSISMNNRNDGADNQVNDDDDNHHEPSFSADKCNIALLFFLYLLQGIPLGLSAAIPILLQNRGSSYVEQAQFSLAMWPFSLKLLWAPIVDYLFIPRWGRRKSWLIPTQYLLGLFLMYLSYNVNDWLNGSQGPSIKLITLLFFILNFLAATQDIAVDGWALTMLKKRNVGYSSTCNSVGQTVGYFLGYVLFMALESADFCNTYLRSIPSNNGLVTLPSYLFMWSCVFIVSTTFVAIFKKEKILRTRRKRHSHEYDENLLIENNDVQYTPENIKESYEILLSVIKLKPVYVLAAILLTAKIGFAACDGVTHLKLMEGGIPKEKMAIMAVPIVPLQILLPIIISKYTTGRTPMNVYIRAYPYRLLMNVIIGILVWVTPNFVGENHSIPYYYYTILIAVYCLEQITVYSMFVATMAFFARISDPSIGGTYMTLLNTLSNLGASWSTTTALWLVDMLTYRTCTVNKTACNTPESVKVCTNNEGKCVTSIDGYFVEMIVCTVFGTLWFIWAKKRVLRLQALGESAWLRRRISLGSR
ncbi:acetyl-coenzyme A transporter 1 [Lycorma delicatula]|uniref:acetyl-coenzyme A transporter 1 n=1 Tax=Lycorma delicatula TaxID=130591 RepID=UPI003F51A673